LRAQGLVRDTGCDVKQVGVVHWHSKHLVITYTLVLPVNPRINLIGNCLFSYAQPETEVTSRGLTHFMELCPSWVAIS
jgi:hypothetical protein